MRKNVYEGKLILAKDIGKLNIAYNAIYKNTYVSGDKASHEYASGMSYEMTPAFRFGLESKGNYSDRQIFCGTDTVMDRRQDMGECRRGLTV